MPGSVPKTLSDDFLERIRKTYRKEFIENVDNPTLLVDYLQCLEQIDEEVVRAQQKQFGAMHAASVLFDRLIRRPEWLEDLKRAFREAGIGLGFLADKLEKFELTVPVHWDICVFTDEYGTACFNDNCSDINLADGKDADALFKALPGAQPTGNGQTNKPDTIQKESVQSLKASPMDISAPDNTMKLPRKDITPKNENSRDEPDALGILPAREEWTDVLAISEDQVETKSKSKSLTDIRESIRMQREELRLKMMEKVYSFIKVAEDVPVAIHYMDKINLQLDKIDHGSVILSIYIGSLDALQTFEQLWRYGGLKKLLDKEMLDQNMVKELKAVAVKAGHPVDNIQSQIDVFDTDIERCRSLLIKSEFDFRPMCFADSYLLLGKSRGKERNLEEVTIYATERLPGEIKSMLEDPFVSDRIASFFESDSLRKKFENEQRGRLTSSTKSVAWYFTEWLNDELKAYLADLDNETKQNLLSLSVYLVHAFEPGGTVAIPYEILSENFTMKEVKAYFPSETADHSFWGNLIKLPSEVVINGITLQTACKELMTKKVICRSKNNMNFLSDLVRDAFVAKVILCSSYKGSMKTITGSFEYVQTLIGLFELEVRCNLTDQAKAEISTCCSFKTNELREIGILGLHTLTLGPESSFYNTDLISCRPGKLELTEKIADAGQIIQRRLKANAKTKHISVDISEVMDNDSFSLEAGLHWLNATARKVYEQGSIPDSGKDGRQYDLVEGITLSNHTLTGENINNIGMYLNVTPSVSSTSLRNCQLKSELLRNVLQSGHFRNIRHLNISDNDIFQGSSQPVGLLYIQSLEKLEVQNCRLGDVGMKLLAVDLVHMKKLRELNLANNKITPQGLLALTKAMGNNRRMTGIRIHKNHIGKDGSFILANWLESLILLEVLNISECGLGDKGSPIIASALVSRSLRKLSMRKNDITPKGSREFFKNFQRPPYFEHLDFSENLLFAVSDRRNLAVTADLSQTASDEPFLKFLQYPTPMSHLSLWNTRAGERRLYQGLQNYKCFEEMAYLCLQENNLSDDFARDVSESIEQSKCTHLQHFNLRQNLIGNMGAIAIAKALSKQMYLKEVLLDRNEIGDEGANQIVSSCISLPSLQRIDLSCNNISRKMMESIVDDIANKISSTSEDISEYGETRHVVPAIIKKQSSFEENSFIIVRDSDKLLITM